MANGNKVIVFLRGIGILFLYTRPMLYQVYMNCILYNVYTQKNTHVNSLILFQLKGTQVMTGDLMRLRVCVRARVCVDKQGAKG